MSLIKEDKQEAYHFEFQIGNSTYKFDQNAKTRHLALKELYMKLSEVVSDIDKEMRK